MKNPKVRFFAKYNLAALVIILLTFLYMGYQKKAFFCTAVIRLGESISENIENEAATVVRLRSNYFNEILAQNLSQNQVLVDASMLIRSTKILKLDGNIQITTKASSENEACLIVRSYVDLLIQQHKELIERESFSSQEADQNKQKNKFSTPADKTTQGNTFATLPPSAEKIADVSKIAERLIYAAFFWVMFQFVLQWIWINKRASDSGPEVF